MNKIKNKVRKDFTIIPNGLINDDTLTDRARFLFCYMASKPEDWNFYQEPLAKSLGYSVDTLRKYLKELLGSGWMARQQKREEGKFDSFDYTLLPSPCGKNTDTVKTRDGEKPCRGNSALYNKDSYKERLNTKKERENAPAKNQPKPNQPKKTPPPDSAPPPSQKQVGARNAPSVEEMAEYLEELFLKDKWQPRFIQNPPETAEEIHDYYTANGWKVGRNPMKDWKAACRNWMKNNKRYATKKQNDVSNTPRKEGPRRIVTEETHRRALALTLAELGYTGGEE